MASKSAAVKSARPDIRIEHERNIASPGRGQPDTSLVGRVRLIDSLLKQPNLEKYRPYEVRDHGDTNELDLVPLTSQEGQAHDSRIED